MPTPHRTPLTAIAAALALAVVAQHASANPYPYPGPPVVATTGGFCSAQDGGSFRVQTGTCPFASPTALTPAILGSKGAAEWNCPVPGSQIEKVTYQALRFSTVSAFGARIFANGSYITEHGDANWPQSPAGGATFTFNLPGGTCNARWDLYQSIQANQHARIYWFAGLTAWVRDLTAPDVSASVSSAGNWVNASQAQITLNWNANDNFGAQGITGQAAYLDGSQVWAANPGPCGCAIALNMAGLRDGTHTARVDVAGNNTAAGTSSTTFKVDRTPPPAGLSLTSLGAGRYTAGLNVADTTSGTASWSVTLPDGRVLTDNAAGTAPLANINLAAWDGRTVQLRITVRDNAGNSASGLSNPVQVDVTPPSWDPALSHVTRTSATAYILTMPSLTDATSGVASVRVAVNTDPTAQPNPGGWRAPVTATPSGAGTYNAALELAGMQDGTHATLIEATDKAGNRATYPGPGLVLASAGKVLPPSTAPPPGVAASLSADPILTAAIIRQLRARKADVTQDTAAATLTVRKTPGFQPATPTAPDTLTSIYAQRGTIRGTVTRANKPLPRVGILLSDTTGRVQAIAVTDTKGRFNITARPTRRGLWQLTALGAQNLQHGVWVELSPAISMRVRRSGRGLTATGRVQPATPGKIVELQWRDTTGWRPLVRGRLNRTGNYTLRYARPTQTRVLRLRLWVPLEQGWPFPDTASRTRLLRLR